MYIGRRFRFTQTLMWSKWNLIIPLVWASVVTVAYEVGGLTFLGIPTLPMSLIGIAVAFYLGFKNNASYDRLWEGRKIWGAIVNASRSWAFSIRDLVDDVHGGSASADELRSIRVTMIRRHAAWMDALRFQLRQLKSWEHTGPQFDSFRTAELVPEMREDVATELARHLDADEVKEVLAQINPAARLLANQSRALADLRRRSLIDGFAHMELQKLLHELMTQQGKAERIKNFPFPRQYATVNFFFAVLFAFLVPFGLLTGFAGVGGAGMVWMTIPFSAIVSWVFLTTDQIGEWSENPFEALANDVPISQMARGIERDILQMADETELPPAREALYNMHF